MSGYNVLHYLAKAGSALNTKRVVMNGNLSPMEVQTLAACKSSVRKYVRGRCIRCICYVTILFCFVSCC